MMSFSLAVSNSFWSIALSTIDCTNFCFHPFSLPPSFPPPFPASFPPPFSPPLELPLASFSAYNRLFLAILLSLCLPVFVFLGVDAPHYLPLSYKNPSPYVKAPPVALEAFFNEH